jgi:pilus assembly protein CpaD
MALSPNLSRAVNAARPPLTLLALTLLAAAVGGCMQQGPRFQAPFTLANPTERHPIQVKQGEDALDLAVSRGSRGLSSEQRAQLYTFLQDYRSQSTGDRLLIRAPSGGPNETAAMRAYDDVRVAMRHAGVSPANVVLQPYYAGGDPHAPLRLSYLKYVAVPPDCPDWSENLARDPQNMPWPNMGCATQRNLAAMVANPEDLVRPRAETPRPGERRDVVWGKYVNGEMTGSKWAPADRPISERATTSDVGAGGGGQ